SRRWNVAPTANRSGLSERTSTASSPLRPWALVILPTTMVGSSTSVDEVDDGPGVLLGGGRPHDGPDGLGGAPALADDLAHVPGAHLDRVAEAPGVLGLAHADRVGIVHQFTYEELDEFPHLRPPWPRRALRPRRPRPRPPHRRTSARRAS